MDAISTLVDDRCCSCWDVVENILDPMEDLFNDLCWLPDDGVLVAHESISSYMRLWLFGVIIVSSNCFVLELLKKSPDFVHQRLFLVLLCEVLQELSVLLTMCSVCFPCVLGKFTVVDENDWTFSIWPSATKQTLLWTRWRSSPSCERNFFWQEVFGQLIIYLLHVSWRSMCKLISWSLVFMFK